MADQPVVNAFIASSRSAMPLAQKLANALGQYQGSVTIQAVRWWEQAEGSYFVQTLIDQTNECDFAAILLTEGDITMPGGAQQQQEGAQKQEDNQRVRDNCIYEAGLFTGALGDPRRCFLLVSCDPRKLPSDLAGLIYIPVTETGNQVDQSIQQAAGRIGQAIDTLAKEDKLRAIRGLKLPTVSVDDLILREKPKDEGGVLQGLSTNVFVNTPQPYEQKGTGFAQRVVNNIIHRDIDYRYVFEATNPNICNVARLIVMLINAAGLDFKKCINELGESLGIYFVPDRRGYGLQYCIHNATDYYAAVCYMRKPGVTNVEWVEWARGSEAAGIADEIDRMCIEGDETRIFRSTVYFKLYDDDINKEKFRRRLWKEIRHLFEKEAKGTATEENIGHLCRACFGKTHGEKMLEQKAMVE